MSVSEKPRPKSSSAARVGPVAASMSRRIWWTSPSRVEASSLRVSLTAASLSVALSSRSSASVCSRQTAPGQRGGDDASRTVGLQYRVDGSRLIAVDFLLDIENRDVRAARSDWPSHAAHGIAT